MTAFCFPDSPTTDHESAVVRAFFRDRLYFKFNPDRFFPYTEDQVQQIAARIEEENRRARIFEAGGDWLRRVAAGVKPPSDINSQETAELIEIIKSVYLYDKESPSYALGKAMMARAGIDDSEGLFSILVGSACSTVTRTSI